MKKIFRLAALLVLAVSVAACSSITYKPDTETYHPGHPGHEVH